MITQAQKKAAVDEIAAANGGVVTPEAVVKTAKNPRHILHKIFPWDDRVAAHKYRLDLARDLIRSIEVIVEFEDVTVSAVSYVHDIRQGRKGQGYASIDALARRREDAQQTVLIELERVIGAIERARGIAGSLGLSSYFETMLQAALEARLRLRRRGDGGRAA